VLLHISEMTLCAITRLMHRSKKRSLSGHRWIRSGDCDTEWVVRVTSAYATMAAIPGIRPQPKAFR
jgi:hypothetical protein